MQELERPGGAFDQLRSRGWKIGTGPDNHIQLVSKSGNIDPEIAAVVATLNPSTGPVVLCVENGEIERSFKSGCTTPLDQWTFGWLMTGDDLRPAASKLLPAEVPTTGHYKLRGNHWSVSGNWNPTHLQVLQHLRSDHANALKSEWSLESWSIEELRSLHDDVHEREEGVRGRVANTSAARPPSNTNVGYRKPGNAAK